MLFISNIMQWGFFSLCLVFMILFIYSILVRPLVFHKKETAAIGYGLYAVLYFLLWFRMLDLQYENSQANILSHVSSIEYTPTTTNTSNINKNSKVNQIKSLNQSSDKSTKEYVDAQGIGTIIGDTESKIYHVPGSTYYDKELKKTSNNVYFKTIVEAESAGYRSPKK